VLPGVRPARRSAKNARMSRILIAGCGDVGTRLGLALATDGDEVRGLRRNPSALPAPITGVRGDLATGDGIRAAADGVQVLVYAAAADGFSDDAYRAAYVDGLQRTLDALASAKAPLERVLFTSSTAVYGQSDGSWVDEDSPTEPPGFSGRRLLEAERLLLGCGHPAAVLRLAGIYGPGRTRLIDEVRGGAATVPEGGDALWTNRIHADDCAGALRHLVRLPAREMQGMWLGVDDEPADRAVVFDWLAERLGVARPRRVPVGDAPARMRPGNKRCSNVKLKRAGYAFRFPTFREGYADVIARLDDRPA
jgi:nucleoside-diphosphate-sugar epimerase